MPESIIVFGMEIPVLRYNTVVVGSGAAGFNAADSLYTLGMRDVAVITEDVMRGTSRNAGSDKQTYYKLTLGGGDADGVAQMAQTLFEGGCVDGDLALCEAGLSAECFFKLVSLGVPFPRDRFGAWPGYKTDHDPRRRATSAGPRTSKIMTEKLHGAVVSKGIPIHNDMQVIKLLTGPEGEIAGALCLNLAAVKNGRAEYSAFCCRNIIFATGGPAGLYKDSVYPTGQHGANGLAFEAGARGANLTEWQYGLASLSPRWNVSGTYMQVLPRFISVDQDGGGEREFLVDCYGSQSDLLTNLFLKGYQWPFDSQKAGGGSSFIDICVFRELLAGRRVFLDYRKNPFGGYLDFNLLSGEALSYLKQAGACFGTPVDRLRHMNMPAVDFYLEHGVDLAREPLEISLCAQHNNGGIAVDRWWRTTADGLFAVGESAATHGVRRPGGSALNAGQAGSLRAAQYIAARRGGEPPGAGEFIRIVGAEIAETLVISGIEQRLEFREVNGTAPGEITETPAISGHGQRLEFREVESTASGTDSAPPDAGGAECDDLDYSVLLYGLRSGMSESAGVVRDIRKIRRALKNARQTYDIILARSAYGIVKAADLPLLYMLRDTCVCQIVYLSAFINYYEKTGKSRGGAIFTENGEPPAAAADPSPRESHIVAGPSPYESLIAADEPARHKSHVAADSPSPPFAPPSGFDFTLDGGEYDGMVQETEYNGDGECSFIWRKVRPIPQEDDFFENAWREFRAGGHIDE